DATTRLTKVPFGTPVTFRDTSVHVAPPSRETWMLPSSAPTHRMSASSGDSLIVVNSLYDDSPSFLESMGSLPSTPMILSVSRFTWRVRSFVGVHDDP